ncbi:copper amine oxidase N-terminal domain-containing protein [Peptoniphilus phoceensis]|uniref:copper amine oxidase N-terminal domain-containing protein n=1 Tax=Peptoniphilus phoceensis TaxID=1720298 RepID=UPI0007819EBA|nr:copper amine oxidase N-terminal domain-containing protein [Peptoniphilus phoceensis]
MKKFKSILFSLVLMIFVTSNVFAGRSPLIEYNGKIVKSDVAPYIQNERTMVPIRFISETLGYKVTWDNDKREVGVKGKDTEILLKVDSKNALVNGKEVKLDSPASIKKDRTFVPLRFVAENLKAEVKWDKENFKVIINDKNSSSLSLNLSADEENYVKEIKSLQSDLNKSIGKLKLSFFDNAANLSSDELNSAYENANSEITNIVSRIKSLNVPDKFKESHEYTLRASEKALEILPGLKNSIMSENEESAKVFIRELTDFQVKMQEATDSFNAALKGEDYKAQKDIDVYKDQLQKQDSKNNLLQDQTLKNIFNRI